MVIAADVQTSRHGDPILDEAIALHGKIESFLQQDIGERAGIQQSLSQLTALFP